MRRHISTVLVAAMLLLSATSGDLALANPGGGGGSHGGGGYGHGWYGGGFRGGWGWGGIGYGLFFASLPWYYDTYWWNGAPYYYADDVYYQWDADASEYETVEPPTGLIDQVNKQTPRKLFMYPKAGQSNEQQTKDREECGRWAAAEAGYDPTTRADSPAGNASGEKAADLSAKRSDCLRAQRTCLEGRNYSVG
jgi:hypothetical protein